MTLPPMNGERDLGDPFQNPPRERALQRARARPAGSSRVTARRRARVGLLVTAAVGVVSALATYVGATVSHDLQTIYAQPVAVRETMPAAPNPVVPPTAHDESAMHIPDGWTIASTPGGTGSFSYAYDPAWTDLRNSDEDRQFQKDAFAAAGDRPEGAIYLAGDWQRPASATTPAVRIRLVDDPVAAREGDLQSVVKAYAFERAAALGDDSPDLDYSGEYTHPLGYEGWRVTVWAHVDGTSIAIDVTGIRYEDAVAFASMTADGYPVPIDGLPGSIVFGP